MRLDQKMEQTIGAYDRASRGPGSTVVRPLSLSASSSLSSRLSLPTSWPTFWPSGSANRRFRRPTSRGDNVHRRADMHIIGVIVIGFVAGLVAKLLTSDRTAAGFIMTTLLGIVGAVFRRLGQTIGCHGRQAPGPSGPSSAPSSSWRSITRSPAAVPPERGRPMLSRWLFAEAK